MGGGVHMPPAAWGVCPGGWGRGGGGVLQCLAPGLCSLQREEVAEGRELVVARAAWNCPAWAICPHDSCNFNSLFWERRDF